MALGDLVVLNSGGCSKEGDRVSNSSVNNMAGNQMGARIAFEDGIGSRRLVQGDNLAVTSASAAAAVPASTASANTSTSIVYLPPTVYFNDLRHDAFEACTPSGPSESGLVSKWRMKDRMKTGCVALVLCLNIGVDPPDVIKISPCARLECWIDPFSMPAPKALDAIGKALQSQYERWQPRARYKLQLDPTVEEVKKLCGQCRKNAKSERVLFHYNGHGVPKPTANGEIWLFNKNYTQYIPLSVYELESWLGTPSIYVFDCSAAGVIVNAFVERQDWDSGVSSVAAMKDCILLAACGSDEILPQSAEFPADIFTSCLTTPIKIALRWFCTRSLLRDSLDPSLVDKIPGRQIDRKTLLGELNWIFTAVTDTIAWNVLPRELFQRLFRQDLLVASLFRNFLLAERIMRSANCTPVSFPLLPPTHQHPMWDAWDMAAEICLSQLPTLLSDPNTEFQPSPFFTEQLTAFEVWLEHGSERKKPPEQLPIVLQVLLSQSHRCRALVLLGRFLDMGAWAVDLALSVGIFPYVLKLLQTTATELRQILVFIWTKILALDKSCQVDLVKDGGHQYFIKFLDSTDVYAEQRAMAAFVLAVIVDGHRRGQEACLQSRLINVCLQHMQVAPPGEAQPEPLLLQWLCLCLGKLWEGFPEAQVLGLNENATAICLPLLSEPQPEVRASAVYALGTLLDTGTEPSRDAYCYDDDDEDEERSKAEQEIAKNLLKVLSDGSPLVRAELAIALSRFAVGHNKQLKPMAAAYLKPPSNSTLTSLPSLASVRSSTNSYINAGQLTQSLNVYSANHGPVLRVGSDSSTPAREVRVPASSPLASSTVMHGSPSSDGSQHSESRVSLTDAASNGNIRLPKSRSLDNAVYAQCVAAMYTLARDPSPRVASLGHQILRIIGVEPVVVKPVRPTGGVGHPRDASLSSVHAIPGLARSFSWLDLNPAPITFRTPPASPPTRTQLMRRVCSLEFSPHMRTASDAGLADSILAQSVTASTSERGLVPQSTIYSWSCGHFSRPLLSPANDDEESLARREERESMTLDRIAKCQHSNVTKVSDQNASWDTGCELGTKAVLLHPFIPIVVVADEKETVRIWNYEEPFQMNNFDNHDGANRGISKLSLVNELDDSMLLVASSDGSVRVWKDYTQRDRQKLATAWQATQGHRPGARSVNAVVDWQQLTGYLYASGEISSIMVWDLDREQLAWNIPSSSESCISALSASQVHGGQLAAGTGDGSVRLYDIRTREMLVCAMRPHVQRVVGIDFQPGLDPAKIVSASQSGDIQFLDIRNSSSPYLSIDAHRGSLTALAVHRHAPVIASGTAKQYIKVFNLRGDLLNIVRYHNSFLGQRIGPVSCLSFHPYNILLAAGATDAIVSIYARENSQAR
ncbi:regulatory-associated protein of TOR 1 isoform X1 [Cryptomeria japonica]|uniref:regulatory-associated protein of TOR 1 isoform X1 n=1 Tax=Cryptomeria japonica TaxID=3369 RepID=UPI0025AC8147|nr:regulatory-associated protein of TOR 1 isoform X1 [Cryptomeria japonica]